MTEEKKDFVSYIVTLVEKFCPGMDHDKALELEDQIRQDWGGEEVGYVAKKRRISAEAKAQAIEEYKAGEQLPEIRNHTGVSRATLYRNLKK
jgi:hypothetical protein